MQQPQHRAMQIELDRLESMRQTSPEVVSQRLFNRYVVRGDAELWPITRTQINHEPIEIKLRDVARGGVGFVADRPLRQGSTWELNLLHSGLVTATQPIVVRYCQEVGQELFLVGAQFIASSGLLAAMGVDPATLRSDEVQKQSDSGDDEEQFLSPSEVA